MKKVVLELFIGLVFSLIGFFFISYLWHFLVLRGVDLRFGGDKGSILSGLVLGLPSGSMLGIILTEKFLYNEPGWNVLGMISGLLLGIMISILGVYLMDKIGTNVIFVIPILVTIACLFGFNMAFLQR